MDFSGLKYSYNRWELFGEPIQNKLRLNISESAKTTLLNDSVSFLKQENRSPNEKGMHQKLSSQLINHIFRCFRYNAYASISYVLERQRNHLSAILSDLDLNSQKSAINALLAEQQSTLISKTEKLCKRKGCSFTFNLDKNNVEYLVSKEGQQEGQYYADNVGNYIKAVLEEYAELPFSEREQVYFSDIIKEIYSGQEQRKLLKLYLNGTKIVGDEIRRHVVYMKPYGIFRDAERLYNYLVGLSNTDHGTEWLVTSIRLSSIYRCDCLSDTAMIHKKDELMIHDAIRMRGIQYISDNNQLLRIIIQLDAEGERMYHRLLHLRPTAIRHSEYGEYEFECTISQAEYYFFKFGHHAIVVEPKSLAEKFKRKYQSALKVYQNDECDKY